MTEFSSALSIAASGMQSQTHRLRYVSENIANADTPGYRRKMAVFEPDTGRGANAGMIAPAQVQLDQSELTRIHQPGHPLADQDGYFDGSNVDLVVELADAREAQRSYEANLRVFDQVRQMSTALNELLRR